MCLGEIIAQGRRRRRLPQHRRSRRDAFVKHMYMRDARVQGEHAGHAGARFGERRDALVAVHAANARVVDGQRGSDQRQMRLRLSAPAAE